MSTVIDLETNYEQPPPTTKPASSKEVKPKGEHIKLKSNDDTEKEEKSFMGLSGTRWSTFMMILLWAICVVLTAFVNPDWSGVTCEVESATDDDTTEEQCLDHGIVNRITSVVVFFFTLQGVLSLFFIQFFDRFWVMKFIAVVGLSLCLLLPETDFFDNEGFQYIARFGGFFFIIFLQILLLDFCYYWKQGFIDKSSASGRVTETAASDMMAALSNVWLCSLLLFSILYILIFVVAMSLLFAYFAKEGCGDNQSIITISLIMMLAALVIQVVLSKNGSIVASGILAVYVAYLTYSAVALNPDADCNPTITNSKLYGVGPQVIGLILSFLAILYTSVMVTRRMSAIMTTGGVTQSGFMNVITGSHSGKSKSGSGAEEQLEKNLRTTVFNLNVIFILLSFYISMTLTNWGTLPEGDIDGHATNGGHISMWMQACGAWIAIALYVVGLIVPNFKIFPTSIWDLRPKM